VPNRIIKESICTSENIDQLTEFQEVFFYRLIVNCDDFGRFDARLKLLSAKLFPLRDISTDEVERALEALQDADLILVYRVKGHPYLQIKTWSNHQQPRANKSKYPGPDEDDTQAYDNNCNQLQSIDINCNQEQEDDSKCHRIRIRNTYSYNDNRTRNTRARANAADDDQLIADEDARKIQNDHDRVLNAADDAGFKVSNSVRAALIRLYAIHGLQKMLDGIASCVKHGAPTLAYLEAVLQGKPKQQKPNVIAQAYEQRDYATDPDYKAWEEQQQRELEEKIAAMEAEKKSAGDRQLKPMEELPG